MASKHDLQRMLDETELNVRSYSGRGMFGKSCLGVEGSSTIDIFHRILVAAVDTGVELETLEEAFQNAAQDAMGLGTIVYFPGIQYVSDDEDDPEQDYSFEEFCERVDG